MLKNLLLSGWFRVQPFLNYVVVVLLLAPIIGTSAYSTAAKQSSQSTPSSSSAAREFDLVSKGTAVVDSPALLQVAKVTKTDIVASKAPSVTISAVTVREPLLVDQIESWVEDENSLPIETFPSEDPLASVELAPPKVYRSDVLAKQDLNSQQGLVRRLKEHKISLPSVIEEDRPVAREVLTSETLEAAKVISVTNALPSTPATVPVIEEPDPAQLEQHDPIGSPYPIPWQWIQATQEAIGSKGDSGVRYYRSRPVLSPDGRYAIYSRVRLEVKPEMYHSRVSSILFIEDKQTKKLQVLASTAAVEDLPGQEIPGKIAVLVPVSWSEKGDRFLARKFQGWMNTSDVTDHAVIWNRQNNASHSVSPAHKKQKHEIAVLLGWSKTQPDNVLFRTGELGDEEWPVVAVDHHGQTIAATETDQPVTYGRTVTDIWAGPQVAYR